MQSVLLALMVALRAVESSSGMDPRAAGNDLQITPICVRDVNRIYGTSYRLADVTDRRRSEEIALLYLSYWVFVLERTPQARGMSTEELAARIWHRGPKRFTDIKGRIYWHKVRKHIHP